MRASSWDYDRYEDEGPEDRREEGFFHQNLAEPWSVVAPVDILILRNILIYFDVDTRREILRRVRGLLRPDGYLLLGSAETTLNIDDLFTRVPIGRTVFYQVTKDQKG